MDRLQQRLLPLLRLRGGHRTGGEGRRNDALRLGPRSLIQLHRLLQTAYLPVEDVADHRPRTAASELGGTGAVDGRYPVVPLHQTGRVEEVGVAEGGRQAEDVVPLGVLGNRLHQTGVDEDEVARTGFDDVPAARLAVAAVAAVEEQGGALQTDPVPRKIKGED